MSSQSKTVEIPFLNNSVLYNNTETDYYLRDSIIKDKIIELRVEYANQITNTNISGEKKNLIEKKLDMLKVGNLIMQEMG